MSLYESILYTLIFAFTYLFRGLYDATCAVMLYSLCQLIVHTYRHGLGRHHLLSHALILVLGTLTLTLKNDLFIKLKPSLLFMIFAFSLVASRYGYGHSWLASTLNTYMPWKTPHEIARFEWHLILFYITLALSNLICALWASNHVWVVSKLIGIPAAHVLFFLIHARDFQEPDVG